MGTRIPSIGHVAKQSSSSIVMTSSSSDQRLAEHMRCCCCLNGIQSAHQTVRDTLLLLRRLRLADQLRSKSYFSSRLTNSAHTANYVNRTIANTVRAASLMTQAPIFFSESKSVSLIHVTFATASCVFQRRIHHVN